MKISSLRWIADRNPFYLLSACSGLMGCWLLGDIAHPDLVDAVMKIGTVLAYEIAVVAAAIWLARRAGTVRDAAILSILTLALAADIAFFYTQAAMLTAGPATFFAVLGVGQSLAIVGVLLRGMRAGLSKPAEWLLALDLTALHLLPFVLRLAAVNHDGLEFVFMLAYASLGTIVAAHALPAYWRVVSGRLDKPYQPDAALPRALAFMAPVVVLASLLAHLVATEWIYDVRFFAVFLSPIFLGYAAIGLRCERRYSGTAVWLTPGGWACFLAVLAALFAYGAAPNGAIWDAGGWSWLGLSPLRFTLAGGAAICWTQWRIRRGFMPIALGASGSFLAALGHTPEAMGRNARYLRSAVRHLAALAFPDSQAGWGALLFIAAFLLLGLGAAISWRYGRYLGASED